MPPSNPSSPANAAGLYNGSNAATAEFYELTVFVQMPFNITLAGGGTYTYYLNGLMLSSGKFNTLPNPTPTHDYMQDAHGSMELHTN